MLGFFIFRVRLLEFLGSAANILAQEPKMFQLTLGLSLAGLLLLGGCVAQLPRSENQGLAPKEQEEEQRKPAIPTFTYRPGAGMIIEGR